MYSLWFLPAVLLAVPLFAVWRIRQTDDREFCVFSLGIFMILTSSSMNGSVPIYVLDGDLRLAEAS